MTKKPEAERDAEELVQQAMVPEEDQPYKVPENWLWVPYQIVSDRVGESVSPFKFPEEIFELYSVPSWDNYSPEFLVGDAIRSSKQAVEPGDVLLCKINPRINRVWFVNDKHTYRQIASSEWIICRPGELFSSKCLMYYFASPFFRDLMNSNVSGVGGSLTRARPKTIVGYPIPLPPLPEQQRIVSVIEALFAKLDRARELLEEVQDAFEEQKATILARAFRGELTAKWREEHCTDDPTKMIMILKEQRINVARSGKERDEIAAMYASVELLAQARKDGWITLKASLICENITCGNTPTGNIMDEGDIPFLKVYNIVDNAVDFIYKPQFIDCETHSRKLKSSQLMPGDVIMNIVGPPLRKIAIIPNDYPEWNMNQAIVRFRPVGYVDSKYLYYCLLNPSTLDDVIRETKGVVGQANISITQSRNLDIPLPPVQEQQEIVRILDNLLDQSSAAASLCDQMEQIDQLKKTILAKAFRGELDTNDPAEESAEKLLREVLRQRAEEQGGSGRKKRIPQLPKAIEVELANTSLENIVRASVKLSSEQLFKQSGIKDMQEFYSQLKDALESGKIIEKRDESGRNVFFEVKP